jgi:hypothetical protein
VYNSTLDETSFVVKNYLFAREELILIITDTLNVTTNVKIKAVNFSTKTIIVEGDYTSYSNIKLDAPFFVHGTPYATNKKLDKEVQYPIVYLLEIIKEQIPTNRDSKFESIPTLRLFFLDEANFNDWDTDKLYSDVVTPQRNYTDYVLSNIKNSKIFGLPTNVEITTYAKFGQFFDNKGVLNSIFNKTLSGVEMRLDLPIIKKCN